MKFTDVNPFNKKIQKRINKSILDTVKKKDFILGNNVNKFEKNFQICQNLNMQWDVQQEQML